jgi:hypothetical protein
LAVDAGISQSKTGVTPVTYRDVLHDIDSTAISPGTPISRETSRAVTPSRDGPTLCSECKEAAEGDRGMLKRSEYLGRRGAS